MGMNVLDIFIELDLSLQENTPNLDKDQMLCKDANEFAYFAFNYAEKLEELYNLQDIAIHSKLKKSEKLIDWHIKNLLSISETDHDSRQNSHLNLKRRVQDVPDISDRRNVLRYRK